MLQCRKKKDLQRDQVKLVVPCLLSEIDGAEQSFHYEIAQKRVEASVYTHAYKNGVSCFGETQSRRKEKQNGKRKGWLRERERSGKKLRYQVHLYIKRDLLKMNLFLHLSSPEQQNPLHYRSPTDSLKPETVLRRSIAIVIGPTPPGTGEIHAARAAASSKQTSPTSR